jgi:hypothetical protein
MGIKRRGGRTRAAVDTAEDVETIVRTLLECLDRFGSQEAHDFPPGLQKAGTVQLQLNYFNFQLGDRTRYTNHGYADSFGYNPSSQTSSQPLDIGELAKQLAAVRLEMKKHAPVDSLDHDEAVGVITSAEKAAKSGDASKAVTYLKGAGRWAADVAKTVAAQLVKDAIEGKINP